MKTDLSESTLYQDIECVMPGGVSSPIRAMRAVAPRPVVIQRAYEDILVDIHGREFVDFWSACGSLILGHAAEPVVQAVREQLMRGSSYGCATLYEAELAKLISTCIPSCELVRFCASGTEATMTAVRMARAITKKRIIVRFQGNYHGHSDLLTCQDEASVLPFNDCDSVNELFTRRSDIACIIVEPIAGNMGVVLPEKAFLELLRKKTNDCGALLIFDEVITGFRVARFSCQALYGISADLTTLGKVVGGGFPLAAVAGKREYMSCLAPLGSVYHAGTHSGNPISVQAGIATLKELQKEGFYERLERKTRKLTDPITRYLQMNSCQACLQRQDSMFTLFFGQKHVDSFDDFRRCDTDRYTAFFTHMLKRGFFIPPAQGEAWFITAAHTDEHLEQASSAVIDFLREAPF